MWYEARVTDYMMMTAVARVTARRDGEAPRNHDAGERSEGGSVPWVWRRSCSVSLCLFFCRGVGRRNPPRWASVASCGHDVPVLPHDVRRQLLAAVDHSKISRKRTNLQPITSFYSYISIL